MKFLDRLTILLSSGFGAGLLPKAPGTFGTLVGIPIVGALKFWLPEFKDQLFASVIICMLGFLVTWRAEKIYGHHDDQRVVIDEVCGILVTLVGFPFTWSTVIAGFILFRLFDIWKPGPVGYIDEQGPGAWGTFFDDILAGFFAAGILYFLNPYLN